MRFLVDQPVSWEIDRSLTNNGHDAVHVRDLSMSAADDAQILQKAPDDNRVIITQDADYGTLLFMGKLVRPSVILFQMRDGRPTTQHALLQRHLPDLSADLEAGAIVVFDDGMIRVRRLRT